MPTQPHRPCAHPGCRSLTAAGAYCPAHASARTAARAAYDATTRKQDPALALAARIRGSVRWQKVRTLHKAQHPLCCDPLGLHRGLPRPNQQSHHVIPLVERPDLAYDLDNLAPTCTRCHARIEAMERSGVATRELFRIHGATTPTA